MSNSATDYQPVTEGDVAKGAGTALLARAGALIEIVSQPAYVLMFGLPTYGLYTVLWSLVNFVENIADLGMTSALQRVVPQASNEAEAVAALRSALLLGVGPCLVLAAIASAFAPALAEIINVAPEDRPNLASAIALFAWALPLWALVEVATSALRARRAFGPEIRLRVFWEQVLRLVAAGALWAAGVDTLGLMIAHLISLAITAAASLRLLGRYYDMKLLFRARSPTARRATLLAGISVLPANIIMRLFSDAPPILLNLWFPGAAGATAAGLFGIARKLASVVQLIRIAFSYVMGPLVSAAVRHDMAAIQPLYGFATRVGTVMALPLAAAIAAGGGTILKLFGPGAAAAWPLLALLTIGRAAESIGGLAGTVQQVASAHKMPALTSAFGFAVAAAFTVWLLPAYGATGLALAITLGLLANMGMALIQLYWTERLHPFSPPFARAFTIALAVAAAMAALLYDVRTLPDGWQAAFLVVTLLAGLWLSAKLGLRRPDKQAMGRAAALLRL